MYIFIFFYFLFNLQFNKDLYCFVLPFYTLLLFELGATSIFAQHNENSHGISRGRAREKVRRVAFENFLAILQKVGERYLGLFAAELILCCGNRMTRNWSALLLFANTPWAKERLSRNES